MNRTRWKIYGIFYFSAVFIFLPSLASAYIDPSVTTYAIQAIAGVAVAAGAFFATYGRRMKKSWLKTLNIDPNETKTADPPLEVTREDLKAALAQKRESQSSRTAPASKKHGNLKGRMITSILCGFAPAMALILRPVISFYLSNEGEYWFRLTDILPNILLVFLGFAVIAALIHFFLPDGKKISLRLLFAAAAAAGTLCVFVQDHFLSFYLPELNGEDIDWTLYRTWNLVSIILWGGSFLVFISLSLIRPRFMKHITYGLLALLLITETVTGGIELASAKHTNRRIGTYFTQNGIYETAEAGNIAVLVSDTFEGTYMNRLIEEEPAWKDLLPDVTYYDNVTGNSIFTHLSYAKFLTGQDFPIGKASVEGMTWCFDHQTTLDRIQSRGWETAYYTEFSPAPSIKDKVINYSDEELHPDAKAAWTLTELLLRSVFFRSAPGPYKWHFIVYGMYFDNVKYELANASPWTGGDGRFYDKLREAGLTKTDGAPRYAVYELAGLHEPIRWNEDFESLENREAYSVDERKMIAARAQLKLLRAYLDALKAAGTYDQTTVIMMADHGFNDRFYPLFLVKEAGRTADGFRVVSSPISMREDYEDLLDDLMSGMSFAEAAAKAAAGDEVRTALDFRAPDSSEGKTNRRTVVEIRGDAKDPGSYHIARDEFILDDHYPGRCVPNSPFISGGKLCQDVAAYGFEYASTGGHTMIFDTFFEEELTGSVTFRATVRNETGYPQRIEFLLNEQPVGEVITVAPESGSLEIVLPICVENASRLTLELDMPDAVLQPNLGETLVFTNYSSISVSDAAWMTGAK